MLHISHISARFGLEVAEDKTRILPIGRFKGAKEDFDFLGFTYFIVLPAAYVFV